MPVTLRKSVFEQERASSCAWALSPAAQTSVMWLTGELYSLELSSAQQQLVVLVPALTWVGLGP